MSIGRPDPTPSPWITPVLALVPVLLGLVLFSSLLDEDSYITFGAARALAEHGEILNFNGERVEMSSSLALVVVLALLDRVLPFALPTIGTFFSIACGICTVLATGLLARRMSGGRGTDASWIAGTSSILIVWSFSGNEGALQATLSVAWILACARVLDPRGNDPRGNAGGGTRAVVIAALVTFALIMTRPEAPLVVLSVLVGAFFVRVENDSARPARAARLATLALIAIALAGLLWAFRALYFGDGLPQPVTAKVEGVSLERLERGLRYMIKHAWTRWDSAIWLLAIPATLRLLWRSKRTTEALTALFFVAQSSFVIFGGGDWMNMGRFLLPMLPIAVVLTLRVVGERKIVTLAIVALNLFGLVQVARSGSPGGPIWTHYPESSAQIERAESWFELRNRTRLHDLSLADQLIDLIDIIAERRPSRPVTVLTGQMGMVSYHVSAHAPERVQFIDRFALTTRHITDCDAFADRKRTSVGVITPYPLFLERLADGAACGIPEPDVIWDLAPSGGKREALLERFGYVIAYKQSGAIPNGSAALPGLDVRADEFIAVKRELLEEAFSPRSFEF